MIKPHIKVMQRNGVDIFVTSSIEYKFPAQMVSVTNEELRNIGLMHEGLRSLGDASVHRLKQITLSRNQAAQGGNCL